jgi:hypothetical protein
MAQIHALSERLQQLVNAYPEDGWKQVIITEGLEETFHDLYARYRAGEMSFGRFARELGLTVWDLTHLLEVMGLATTNLPG